MPPAYSAVKVGGERAYKRARRGESGRDAAAARHRRTGSSSSAGRARSVAEFEIECSSGTYVRSLIADLGDAYCVELRRTAIGPFTVEEADETAPLALAEALARLDAAEAARVRARE